MVGCPSQGDVRLGGMPSPQDAHPRGHPCQLQSCTLTFATAFPRLQPDHMQECGAACGAGGQSRPLPQ